MFRVTHASLNFWIRYVVSTLALGKTVETYKSIDILSFSLVSDGRGGSERFDPVIDVLVADLRNKSVVFQNLTFSSLKYPRRVCTQDRNDKCELPLHNVTDFFAQYYFRNLELFQTEHSDKLTVLTTSDPAEAVTEFAYFAAGANLPLIIAVPDLRLSNLAKFPTVLNFFPMPDVMFFKALDAMAEKYLWTTATAVCDVQRTFYEGMCMFMYDYLARIHSSLRISRTYVRSNVNETPNFDEALQTARERRRVRMEPNRELRPHPAVYEIIHVVPVILTLLPINHLRQFMIRAHRHNMTNGDYVFVTFSIVAVPALDGIYWKAGDADDEDALQGFQSLLMIADAATDVLDGPVMANVYESVESEYKVRYNLTIQPGYRDQGVPLWSYEAFHMLAQVVEDVSNASEGVGPFGKELVTRFLNRTFRLPTRDVHVDINGVRTNDVAILRTDPTGRYKDALYYVPATKHINSSGFIWFSSQPVLPGDIPECGLRGEKCWYTRFPELPASLGTTAAITVVLAAGGLAFLRRRLQQKELMALVVRQDLLLETDEPDRSTKDFDGAEQARLKGELIWAKRLMRSKLPGNNLITNRLLHEIRSIAQLRHEFVAPFLGIAVSVQSCYYLSEYCPKGNLRQVLQYRRLFLDTQLRVFWTTNIIEGLIYIHRSVLKRHGFFTMDSCLVTSRYCVRIGFAGARRLSEILLETESKTHAHSMKMMEMTLNLSDDARQLGLVLADLFGGGEVLDSALLGGQSSVLFNSSHVPPGIQEIVQECLVTKSDETWNMTLLQKHTRAFSKSKGHIVELLRMKLDEYAETLEETVRQRTVLLIRETQKVDMLLQEMFPRSVIPLLRNRQAIHPELFESATVLFSDIPAFAELVFLLNPIRIVEFLNSMHSKFDSIVLLSDAYKVETISDSYVLVSGVPERNGQKHAAEICSLALSLLTAGKMVNDRLYGDFVAVRIGINSGVVVAGVVGTRMPRYCLFGDAMNTASRMESHGMGNKIHVTKSAKVLTEKTLPDHFTFESRGVIQIKGKGLIETFWLFPRAQKKSATS